MSNQSAVEQALLEMLNRARLDPAAEAARFGINLNEGVAAGETISTASKQPLAMNDMLLSAARAHSQSMLDHDYFAHDDPFNNTSPDERMSSAGYSLGDWAENIAWRGTTGAVTQALELMLHQDLFVDEGFAGRGHRVNMMDPDLQEVGMGEIKGQFTQDGTTYNAAMLTQDFGTRSGAVTQFLTGVTFNDTVVGDKFYTIGEGRGNVTIGIAGGLSAATGSAGGYSEAIGTGVKTVTFSGGGLATPVVLNATIASGVNAKIDLMDQSTIRTSVSVAEVSGISTIIGLGTIGLTLSGGSGSETISGTKGNDTINGGDGVDSVVFLGTRASYTITDFGHGSVRAAGAQGTDTLNGIEKLVFTDQTVTLPPVGSSSHASNDFDGDGKSDLLLRNSVDGSMRLWELTGAHIDANSSVPGTPNQWQIAGTGDFNGDSKEDILWRNSADGSARLWEMNGAHVDANLGLSTNALNWKVAGTADFDGDGKEDILWRDSNTGALRVWEMNGNRVDANVNASSAASVWHLESTGDFNGDHKADLLWRNANDGTMRLWEMDGGRVVANLGISGNSVSAWGVATTGDFDGDGREDILWRNKSDGSFRLWEMNGNHVDANLSASGAPNVWHVEDARDVNGDGRDDILFRNTSDGSIRVWEMNGNHVDANLGISNAALTWKIAVDPFDLV